MQLSDTQTAILAAAVARDDRMVFPVDLPLKGGAVGNVLKSLLKRGLVEEVPTADHGVVWRCGEDGSHAHPARQRHGGTAARRRHRRRGRRPARRGGERGRRGQCSPPASAVSPSRRCWSLLQRPEGATIADMQEATGWLPHSVRGALSGVVAKKLGHVVTSTKEEGRGRVYRIAS